MWWTAWWALVAVVGVAGTVASLNSVRFARRVGAEARALTATAGPAETADALSPARWAGLPSPVERYLRKALGGRSRSIRFTHLRHGGTFRPSLNGSWLPIRGEQYFRSDPPAFVWWGRVRIAPGIWIDARDRSVDGAGNMLVTAESTFTIADSRGPQLDQGALGRLLGEIVWFPTAFLDERYVRWSAADDHSATATLSAHGQTVTGRFEFGGDDLVLSFTADRFRDVGGGKAVLTPFVGSCSDYRPVDGVLVPHRMVGAWLIDGRPHEYADFRVEQLTFT